ncbi:helix-turn-helix domain-containing protein [Nocardia brasiliensis]|uniref:helix-turn-helix domain-containing protein n=1 Tax=Nocardia brasiliensis TaxID=37326 RepID=UPI002458E64D|nr:helix-turn-helix domain-containing protein [Nocardia brasiliensis]
MPQHAERVTTAQPHRHSLPSLAQALRDYRVLKGVSRAQVAARGFMSASLIEKWELEGRVPSPEKLAAWFEALEVPFCYRKKIIALVPPQFSSEDYRQLHPDPTVSDLLLLDQFPGPSCYLLPVGDIVAANRPFIDAFPGLAPTPGPIGRTNNVLEWMLLHPAARVTVRRNWYQRAHAMVSDLRFTPPGLIKEARYRQVISTCSRAPEFEQMWEEIPSEAELLDENYYLWHPPTQRLRHYLGRLHAVENPPRQFQWFTLVDVPSA